MQVPPCCTRSTAIHMPSIIVLAIVLTKISPKSSSNSHHTLPSIYRVSGNRKKETKMASYWGRSWGSWSVLRVGVCVGVGMSQNYANAVWLLKYVNVVRSSLTLCSSSFAPSSFACLLFLHFAAQFSSFLICHFSFVASLSLSVCLFDAFNKFWTNENRIKEAGWVRTPTHVMQMGTLSWGRLCNAGINGGWQHIRVKLSNNLSNYGRSWQFGYSEDKLTK